MLDFDIPPEMVQTAPEQTEELSLADACKVTHPVNRLPPQQALLYPPHDTSNHTPLHTSHTPIAARRQAARQPADLHVSLARPWLQVYTVIKATLERVALVGVINVDV